MELIRLVNETPEVYTEQSRDFQLLCRLYDCVINGLKFDTDNVVKVINTPEIRTNLLPLLQTKLGFFSTAHIEDTALRKTLEAFPLMVKKKGSLEAIGWAVNVYLKSRGVRGAMVIAATEEDTQVYDVTLPDHMIIIGLNTLYQESQIQLKEMFKYILPAGFGYFLYFYVNMQELSSLVESDSVAIIYVSDDLNAMVRRKELYSDQTTTPDEHYDVKKRNLGGVALMEVIGNEHADTALEVDVISETPIGGDDE